MYIYIHNNITRNALKEVSVWIYLTYNRTSVFAIYIHNEQSRTTGIETALLSAAEKLKQSVLESATVSHHEPENQKLEITIA